MFVNKQPNKDNVIQLTQQIKQEALNLGFSAVGITDAQPLNEAGSKFDSWLDRSLHGTMHWLAKTRNERRNPRAFFKEAASVIVVALNYHQSNYSLQSQTSQLTDIDDSNRAKFAQYALGRDYHKVMRNKLKKLARFIETCQPEAKQRVCVDSFPLLEKPLAQKAGLGWIGKNTNLIIKGKGSFFFLGELLTSLTLASDPPFEPDHCGSCTACQQACPTDALRNPFELIANQCIAYLTIEHHGEVKKDLLQALNRWVFGCDICQEVCPWNKFATPHTTPDFNSRLTNDIYLIERLLDLTPQDFATIFSGTPIIRAGYERFMTSVKAAHAFTISPPL
jgi:epoxyqueuosine reductase